MKKSYLFILAMLFTASLNAQTLYQENFNAGIGAWTITDYLNDGNTWFGTTGGLFGQYLDGTEFALVDSDSDGNGAWMIEDLTSVPFDATLGGAVTLLEFDHYFRSVAGGDSATVQIFDGLIWHDVAVFSATTGDFGAPNHQVIDVTAYTNANMQIRFNYNDNDDWAWYWAIDNVIVYSPLADDAGTVAILTNSGVNLSATESIDITIENFGVNTLSNVPVFYRINGGTPVGPELVPGPIVSGATVNHTFATTADFSVAGNYLIEAWTELPGDGEDLNDTLSKTIQSLFNGPITLPFCADFEDAIDTTITGELVNTGAAGLAYLTFETDNPLGRLRTAAGTGFAQSGTHAMTMDMNPSGPVVVNYLTFQLDLDAYDAMTSIILMDYSFMEHGDEVQAADSVWIRGSSSDSWIGIADWNVLTGGVNGQYFTQSDVDLSAILMANTQNFSTTFEIRFGQEDNFPATSTTASDGFTIDDVCIRELLSDDASPIGVISPLAEACGSEMMEVCATITNEGANTISSMPVTLNWNDGVNSGTETITYTGSLGYGEIDTVCFAPINSIAGGTFTFEVITELPGDLVSINDTIVATSMIVNQLIDIDTTYCINAGDSVMLFANVIALDDQFIWYDSLVGGTVISMQDTLWTGALSADTSFYVERTSVTSFNIGATDNSIGASAPYSFYTDGLIFDTYSPIVIDSFTIYPEAAGQLEVRLLDNVGGVVSTVSVAVPAPAVAFDPYVVAIDMPVAAGTGWRLDASGTTISQMTRNSSGGVYPYTETGIMEITGPINALGGYYYFFYNWHVSTQGCLTPRYEIQVNQNPIVTISELDTMCINNLPLTLSEGMPAGGTYSGDGVSAGSFDPSIAGIGTHDITYEFTNSNGCIGEATTTIYVDGCASVSELGAVEVQLFPNPASEELTILVGGEFNFTILDTRGSLVLTGNGTNKTKVNTSQFIAGVYFVSINTTEGNATVKLIVN